MHLLDWMAGQHIKVVVFALATGLILPYALIAAQRPGRGIKPWWTTSRFLSWVGISGAVFALITGELLAKKQGLLGSDWVLRGSWSDLKIHQYFGGGAVFFGILCLRAAYQPRKEHQGLGMYALVMGLFWAVSAGTAGHYGFKMARINNAGRQTKTQANLENEQSAIQATDDSPVPTNNVRIFRILDYASLVPIHSAPVRSAAHNNRWIRVWVSSNAAEAYTSGNPLPYGTLVVMNSVEDRWGLPSYDIGPLYSLEVLPNGKSRIGMYWSYVPESKRNEFNGAKSVSWVEPNPNLAGCAECHADGMAPFKSRSRALQRKPKTESDGEDQQT
ncbi:MAG: hypothetical protein LBH03_00015 [Holophagales bacterium]|jgi:hypothetical protein|nr:hypothetical protein [Holophagales bacterium]